MKWGVLRCATAGLILMGLSVVFGSVYLIGLDKDVPDGIIALGSAAVGALATLMTTSSIDVSGSTVEATVKALPEEPDGLGT